MAPWKLPGVDDLLHAFMVCENGLLPVEVPATFAATGRTIHLVPVRQDLTGGHVSIPPERIKIRFYNIETGRL